MASMRLKLHVSYLSFSKKVKSVNTLHNQEFAFDWRLYGIPKFAAEDLYDFAHRLPENSVMPKEKYYVVTSEEVCVGSTSLSLT